MSAYDALAGLKREREVIRVATATEAVDVILRDGRTLRLRPPQREDAESLLDFFRSLSEQSLYLRFHGFATVDARIVEPLLDPDWEERGALLGTLAENGDERVVAVGNYVRLRDPSLAEAAFAVADEHQRRGIGTRLLERLADRAGRVGYRALRRRGAARQPQHARRLRGRRLRALPRARRRRGRGRVPDRIHRDVSRAGRRARPRRGSRVAPAVLRAGERRRHRRVAPARVDRRRALPEHPRGGLRGCGVPREPGRRARGRRACVRLDRGHSRPRRPRRHLAAGCGRARSRRAGAPQGRPRARRHLRRASPRSGARARERQERLLALVRAHGAAHDRPELPRYRGRGAESQRHLRGALGAERQHRLLLPERRARARLARGGRGARARASPSFVSIGNKADVSSNDLLEWWEDEDATQASSSCTSSRSATHGASGAWPAASRGESRSSR